MNVGTKVTGSYLGNKFSGVVTEYRFLTVKTDGCVEHMVTLDSPLNIFGRVAETIVAHTLFDGQASSYTRFDTWMVPA